MSLIERTIYGLHSELRSKLPTLKRSDALLDVGCGTGAWLARLDSEGFTRLYGLEKDVPQIDFPAKLHSLDLDRDNWPFEGSYFHLITAIEVIEHLHCPGHFFEEAARTLHPNGSLIITTPNIHSIESRLRFLVTGKLKSFDFTGDPTHVFPITRPALDRMLDRYNLRIKRAWGYPERGTVIAKKTSMIASRFATVAFGDPIPGDTMCIEIRRVPPDEKPHHNKAVV